MPQQNINELRTAYCNPSILERADVRCVAFVENTREISPQCAVSDEK